MWIWIAWIAGGLVGLVVMMALIGLALPRAHIAARSAVLPRPPDAVWAALTDLDAQVRWRRGLKRVEHLPDRRFREHTTQGTITFAVDAERPPALRITRIDDPRLPFGGRWIYELATVDAGTRLTITEDGFIKNPIFRFLAHTVFGTGRTLEQFLTDLARHLGVETTQIVITPATRDTLAR